MQAIHKNQAKIFKNRASMFFKHASMIFSSPVKSRVMFTGILGIIFLQCFYCRNFGYAPVFAESTTGSSLNSTANFSVIVPEVNTLEITLSSSNLVLNLTPQMAEASFGSKDLTITVGTSNIAGYNLMMNTSNTALTSAAEDTIESLDEDEDGYTCSTETCNFTMNRWGFKKDSETVYNYVPSSVSLASNDAPTNGEDTTINFASRVDAQQPAGTYSTTLTFVATINPTSMTINDVETLQDFATLSTTDFYDVLDSMMEGEAYEKSDNRDNKTYNIAKLADGNIWFLDNLRLDPNTQGLTLDSTNTNVTTTPSVTFTNKTSGWGSDAAYTSAWYNLGSETTEQPYGSGNNYIGGYYNYCAASAGSYCMNSSSGSGNANQDLCPAGWRMPTGGTGGEYATLTQAITGASGNLSGTDRTNFMNAAHIAPSGSFWSASAQNQGSTGVFWSSTFSSMKDMYNLSLDISTVSPTNPNFRVYGFSIRCVVKAGTEMQNLSASTVARKLANVNDVASLVDTRDYQPYSVAKLADNKIWMTKNLNLPGGTEIESTKSDVPADYVLPTANGFQSGNKLPATETISSGTTLANSNAFSDNSTAYVYNSNSTTCGNNSPCYSYYSWTTATVGSGLGITTANMSALYSICPKGWRLPSTYDGIDSMAADYDFRALMIAYGGSHSIQYYTTSTTPTGATIYDEISATSIPNFLLTGLYIGNSFGNGGSYGYYWSSTSYSSTRAPRLYFNSTTVNSASSNDRRYGCAIRCLLAN